MNLIALPALTDNYIWIIHDGAKALVVDPGDACVVFRALEQHGLRLSAILLTHHHADHTAGVDQLRDATGCAVYGPALERLPEPVRRVAGGDALNVLGVHWAVMDVPGHTAGHVAYFCADFEGSPLVFCGDTLFSGGCGRLFEGTPEQMKASLDALVALPGSTRVCCAHEYTLANLRFAKQVDPSNTLLLDYELACGALRARGLPTLPSTIERERQINPFLRCSHPAIKRSAVARSSSVRGDVDCFAVLREWKNQF